MFTLETDWVVHKCLKSILLLQPKYLVYVAEISIDHLIDTSATKEELEELKILLKHKLYRLKHLLKWIHYMKQNYPRNMYMFY